jgi:hypothetical protein
MAISAAVFMIPYFPESLGNWKFRSMHMMFGRPFWYATYLPISNFYFKGLNIVTIWACVGVVTILFVLQKIKLDSAFALIIIAALCLDVYNSINRMLIAIVLVAVLGNLNMKQTLTLAGAMFVFIPLQPYTPETITNFHILIFHIPVTLGFLFWAYNSATGSLTRSKNWEKDDQDTVPALT